MTEETRKRIIENVQVFKKSESVYKGIIKPLLLAGKKRKERFIRVCCVCHDWQDYDDRDGEWNTGRIPPGHQSHTYCPPCAYAANKQMLEE